MAGAIGQSDGREAPEKLVQRLAAQLSAHALWDALLNVAPPLAVIAYVASYSYRTAWIGPATLLLVMGATLGAGLLAVRFGYRPFIPSIGSAARLVDDQAGAQDRFLTLATIEPAPSVASLLSRLRQEAAGFQERVELRRDFPYRIKRSFYVSLLGSLVALLALQLLLPMMRLTSHPGPRHAELRSLAEKMAERPGLADLARELKALTAKLEDPSLSAQEKQALLQQMQERLEKQQKNPQQKDNQDLLGQATGTLQGLEQQSGSGQNQHKDQDKGGGGIQSNLPQKGQGEGKESQGSGGDSKGDRKAQLNKEMEQGKSVEGNPQDRGQENSQQKNGEGKGKRPDANKPDQNQSQEITGKAAGPGAESGGRGKASEEIPRGAPPAERFNPAGDQGKEGIKGARYVTVQLPEEVAADAKGESRATRRGGESKARPKLPVSNVPLPAHVPDAPAEKQPMPLEYRGMIR